jgi:L-methionine (R)-S-oxide reductase
VLTELERALGPNSPKSEMGSTKPLEHVVETLGRHRGYFWIGVYLTVGKKLVCKAYRGRKPPRRSFDFSKGMVGAAAATGFLKFVSDTSQEPSHSAGFRETRSQIVVPIRMGSRVLGVIDVQSDRADAFRYQDKVLLQKAALLLARFITSRGKALERKSREQAGLTGYGYANASQDRRRPRKEASRRAL